MDFTASRVPALLAAKTCAHLPDALGVAARDGCRKVDSHFDVRVRRKLGFDHGVGPFVFA